MSKGIYITIADLMSIKGINNYYQAHRLHRLIRDSFSSGKRKLTIKEFCCYEGLDPSVIMKKKEFRQLHS